MNIKQSPYDMFVDLCHFFGKNVFFNYRFYQKLAPSLLIIMTAWIVYSQEIDENFQVGDISKFFNITIIAILTLVQAGILYRYNYIEYLVNYRKKSEKGHYYDSGAYKFETTSIIFISLIFGGFGFLIGVIPLGISIILSLIIIIISIFHNFLVSIILTLSMLFLIISHYHIFDSYLDGFILSFVFSLMITKLCTSKHGVFKSKLIYNKVELILLYVIPIHIISLFPFIPLAPYGTFYAFLPQLFLALVVMIGFNLYEGQSNKEGFQTGSRRLPVF